MGVLQAAAPAHAYVLKETSAGDPVRWDQSTVAMRVAPAARCGPPHDDLVAAVDMAMDAWRVDVVVPVLLRADGEPPPDFGYQPAYFGEGNGVYVSCDDWPFEHSHAVTVATFAPDGRMLDADIVIDGTRMLTLLPPGGATVNDHDLASVLTHEMGHVLGLDESERENATMWPTTMPGDTRQRTLTADDENGIIDLYEDSTARLERYGCSTTSMDHAPGAVGWGMALLLICRLRRRRP